MLFDLLIGAMDTAIDALEFGPAKAVRINTSFCPQAERDFIRLDRETKEALDKISAEPEETEADEDICPVPVDEVMRHTEDMIRSIFSTSNSHGTSWVWQIDEETESGQCI